MDVHQIRALVTAKGAQATDHGLAELAQFGGVLRNEEIREYLMRCLPDHGIEVSGVRLKSLDALVEENLANALPGRNVFPLGMLVIATSIGGNAVCLDQEGGARWVDPQIFFGDEVLSYISHESGEWLEVPNTPGNLRKAAPLLARSIEAFLVDLLSDRLTAQLEELD